MQDMLPTPTVKNIDYEEVYEPSEDSFLLLDCFEKEKDYLQSKFKTGIPLVTEIGTGSGIVTAFVAKHIVQNGIFLTTDINPHACKTVLQTVKYNNDDGSSICLLGSTQMDLTAAIKEQEIDLLIFNPPYVPSSEIPDIPKTKNDPVWLDLALVGGEDGMVITWKVLNNLNNILSKSGVAYILFCARNKPENVASVMQSKGWNVEVVINRKAGWEVLSVLKFTRI
ncbi:N5-glutamine methyltransferase, putative [Candida dubliniensis CD36]|uniref:N5-glutamine methyltransferase, putative n=1 Tax=Candida dubliniensis (strain CD36 / ATCC MYA-646 / CBS 7987 / NCPF 3949 / NRRL Y-17841) TaxID=573826 RepID=B9WDT8_CANDC|nr:N5-glutamine methyltransferase, putative [Candida dubliniensis CD36]CAX42845.1 N5-glutamine methyltransferase, putative [Candida dubliniensis CD36]